MTPEELASKFEHRADDLKRLGRLEDITDAAADMVRHGLNHTLAGLVAFEPGDMTRYMVMIHRLGIYTSTGLFTPFGSRYWVSCSPAGGGGGSCEWAGHEMIDPGYVTQSWRLSDPWTGFVLSLFLTALADELRGGSANESH